MNELLFALNATAPIILTVALGYILKLLGIFPEGIAKAVNKLVFRTLLPVMLFLNVCNIESIEAADYRYILFVIIAVSLLFAVSIPLSSLLTKERKRRAPLIQAVFRSNYAIIGIPLATNLFGGEGAAVATLLSAVSIPLFNIFSVIALTLFDTSGKKPSVKKILKGIISNPLIIGIFLGAVTLGIVSLLRSNGVDFRITDLGAIYTVLNYLSRAATPIALLSLGALFNFSAISSMKKEIIFGTAIRTLITPSIILAIAYFMGIFKGAHFAAFVGLFTTPLAVSSVPMTQEMGSDEELAGQLVIWTTLTSAVSIFLFSYILKLLGIF